MKKDYEFTEDRFEELPDDVDIDALLESLPEIDDDEASSGENVPTFNEMYQKVRNVFTSNNQLIEELSEKTTFEERIQYMLQLDAVKRALKDLSLVRENPSQHPELPKEKVSQWKTAPELSYGANKQYPFLSKAVEVASDELEGRHMIAKQKINPGDVLVVDRAYSTSLFRDFYQTHCLNCFRRLKKEYINCPTCNQVKFCNADCYSESYNSTHRWECGVLELMDNEEIGKMATIAYRIVAKTGFNYLNEVKETLASTKPSYGEGDYPSAYNQIDNAEKRPTGDHLKRSFTALVLARCLQLTHWFPENLRDDATSPEFIYIASLLLKHIQACSCNAYEINEFIKKGSSMINSESLELGGAVYPTISLSNHACNSNTSRTNYGTYCCVRATKTIFPNEKITDNYGRFYHTEEKESRQNSLALQYFFSCNCESCNKNWPMYKDFGRKESSLKCPSCGFDLGTNISKVKKCKRCKKDLKTLPKLVAHLNKLQMDFRNIMDAINVENAEKYIATYSKLLSEVEKIFTPPCRQITECEQVLLQSYAVLGNHSFVEPRPEECQVALFTGNQDSSSEEDSDGEDMPDLL